MQAVLALDQGTTSSRALLFDRAGNVLAVAQKELTQIYPRSGWVEQDPEEIWATQLETARAALSQAGLGARDIAAIGITNQRETTVLWGRRSGRALANAIVWQDRRTAALCEQLRSEGLEHRFTERTGLILDAYFSGTKLRWLLDQVPGARARAEKGELAFGTVDAWLVWRLSGGERHVTDASNASRTLMYDIHRGDWDDGLLELLRVPRAVLPAVVPSSGVCAEAQPAHFGHAIPVAGIAGDQQAALFGQQCVRPGMVKNTYGTGCFMLMQTGARPVPSRHRLLTTVSWDLGKGREYALEGSVFIAGAAVQWLRDGLGVIRSSGEVEALARSVPDNGGVYFVPALSGLGAPHWDPHARGAIVGLSRGSTAGHVARAALEAIAYQTADVLDAMHADSAIGVTELRVDGGATQNDLLMQFQADMLGVPVVRPKVYETTALGAAYLAGLAVGFWPDGGALAAQWRLDRRFEPALSADRRAALRADWARAVQRSLAWAGPA
jgi:glycerol kinase